MASGDLVEDPQPNLTARAHRTVDKVREYEFAFPMKNESPGNTAWERDRSYQIAVLVGPTREFKGVAEDTWMSDQILLRTATPSTASIYHPPLAATPGGASPDGGRHGHESE